MQPAWASDRYATLAVDTPHGPVRFPGVPTWFSRAPGRVAGPAPDLGADTAGVLEELGLAAAVDVQPGAPI